MGQHKSTCYTWIFLTHLIVFLTGCSFISYSLLDSIHTFLIGFKHTWWKGSKELLLIVQTLGSNSVRLPVLSCVPQGSILGPMLFLCYINVLPICTQNSTTALFADDSKCFRPTFHSINDCLLLQKDIGSLYNWSKMWDLHYHPSKCQIIYVTKKKMLLSLIIVWMTLFCVELIQLRIWALTSHLVLFGMIILDVL